MEISMVKNEVIGKSEPFCKKIVNWKEHAVIWFKKVPNSLQTRPHYTLALFATINTLFATAMHFLLNATWNAAQKCSAKYVKPFFNDCLVSRIFQNTLFASLVYGFNYALFAILTHQVNQKSVIVVTAGIVGIRILVDHYAKAFRAAKKYAEEQRVANDKAQVEIKKNEDALRLANDSLIESNEKTKKMLAELELLDDLDEIDKVLP